MELKVGLFVLLGLILAAALVVLFSKGTAFYQPTITVNLKVNNVGSIKSGANVILSGVPVGDVGGVELAPDGKSATIFVRIRSKYHVYSDARFEIEQFGFLGDQYIAIYPGENKGKQLVTGDEIICKVPFNMQEALAKATTTISKIGEATTNLDAAVSDVRRLLLKEDTLKNLAGAIDRFALLTSQASDAVSNVNSLVASSALPVSVAVSNLNSFAAHMVPVSIRVEGLLSNNDATITEAIKNVETASALLTNLLSDLGKQKGLAGRLLSDEKLADDFAQTAHNLSVTSSNLNRLGLWGILWKQREPSTNATTGQLRSPRDSKGN